MVGPTQQGHWREEEILKTSLYSFALKSTSWDQMQFELRRQRLTSFTASKHLRDRRSERFVIMLRFCLIINRTLLCFPPILYWLRFLHVLKHFTYRSGFQMSCHLAPRCRLASEGCIRILWMCTWVGMRLDWIRALLGTAQFTQSLCFSFAHL